MVTKKKETLPSFLQPVQTSCSFWKKGNVPLYCARRTYLNSRFSIHSFPRVLSLGESFSSSFVLFEAVGARSFFPALSYLELSFLTRRPSGGTARKTANLHAHQSVVGGDPRIPGVAVVFNALEGGGRAASKS
jgi:hypothetical protein